MRKVIAAALIVGAGLAPVALIATVRAAIGAPVILYNPSPSEPVGFYRLTRSAPGRGTIIAFLVPAAGRPYAAAHLPYIARSAILKEIAASDGAMVCEKEGALFINGQARGSAAATDRHGVALPRWSGCRRLATEEYFVLSNRIPNSFDSRYYGPVPRADVIGVYRPLWTE
jgi:conjugative transfer signal peptidase TraF